MSTSNFRLTGKRLCDGERARVVIERELREALRKAGFVLQRFLMTNSPVRTGTLRRSWNVSEPGWRGMLFAVRVGSSLIYAGIVDRRGKSQGYIGRAVDGARAQVKEIIREALRRIKPQLYVPV